MSSMWFLVLLELLIPLHGCEVAISGYEKFAYLRLTIGYKTSRQMLAGESNIKRIYFTYWSRNGYYKRIVFGPFNLLPLRWNLEVIWMDDGMDYSSEKRILCIVLVKMSASCTVIEPESGKICNRELTMVQWLISTWYHLAFQNDSWAVTTN